MVVEAGVGAVPVAVAQPGRQAGGAQAGVGVGAGAVPLAQRGLDEPLGLAVGSGRVRPGAEAPGPQPPAQLFIGNTVSSPLTTSTRMTFTRVGCSSLAAAAPVRGSGWKYTATCPAASGSRLSDSSRTSLRPPNISSRSAISCTGAMTYSIAGSFPRSAVRIGDHSSNKPLSARHAYAPDGTQLLDTLEHSSSSRIARFFVSGHQNPPLSPPHHSQPWVAGGLPLQSPEKLVAYASHRASRSPSSQPRSVLGHPWVQGGPCHLRLTGDPFGPSPRPPNRPISSAQSVLLCTICKCDIQ